MTRPAKNVWWFTAAEIATLRLPHMPTSRSGVQRLAARQRWSEVVRHGEPYSRLRAKPGRGREYHAALFADDAQFELVRLYNDADPIPDRIRRERYRLGLTQACMAYLASVSPSCVSQWENGISYPNAATLRAWHQAGADILFIVTGQTQR